MPLTLRNGAPLSGALFVSKSNPARRGARSLASFKAKGTGGARRNTLLMNLHGNGSKTKANGTKAKTNGTKKNPLLLNLHGNGAARRNTLLMNLHGNRGGRGKGRRIVRRNAMGAFSNQFTAPVEGLARKIPVVGNTLAGYVSPILMGVVVGAVHYGVMRGVGMIPGASKALRVIAPVKFTVQGAVVAGVLQVVPVGSKELRNQVAAGALLVGGALDIYRLLSDKVGDLGDADLEGDDLDGDDLDGDDLDGDDESEYDGLALTDMSGLALSETAGLGDGMAYDVVPFAKGPAVDYSGASLADAHYTPADFSVQEGQAAVAGPQVWRQTFGDAPVQAINYNGQGVSSLAGRPGHRFGWLICLVGWDRFAKIAALPPEKRVALLDQLKQQAISTVEQQTSAEAASQAVSTVPAAPVTSVASAPAGETAGLALQDLSGLALNSGELGATLFAGSAF